MCVHTHIRVCVQPDIRTDRRLTQTTHTLGTTPTIYQGGLELVLREKTKLVQALTLDPY